MDAAELTDQATTAIAAGTAFALVAVPVIVFRHSAGGFFSWLGGILRAAYRKVRTS